MKENTLAIVTTKSGRRYLARWTYVPGIDYYWRPVLPTMQRRALIDPDVSYEVIG